MLESATPFAGRLSPATRGGRTPAGVVIAELRPKCWLELASFASAIPAGMSEALAALAGGVSPQAIGASVNHDDRTIGRIAPRRFLVIGAAPPPALIERLAEHCVVVDDSHAKAGVRISGAAVDVLRKGLSVDFDERAFPVGRIIQARGFHVGVTVIRRAADSFDIYGARSFAASLLDAVLDAALEVGWQAGETIS